jgi:predicted membrane-bound spermidine synthase
MAVNQMASPQKHKNPFKTQILFSVILLEGYVVLSSELMAIRLLLPHVGSGTDTVSIIIAAVLMPLALGYYAGGTFIKRRRNAKRKQTLRRKLVQNFFWSLVFLVFGLSYVFLEFFFEGLRAVGISNRIALTSIYAGLWLIIPVYLLGQTIPLITHYFRSENQAIVTGKILCFSTFGSFMGAVFATLVLMATVGVHYTAALNFIILVALIVLISKKKITELFLIACAIAAAGVYANSEKMMSNSNIVKNNQFNTSIVQEDDDGNRHLILNNATSSMYGKNGEKHTYISFMEDQSIKTWAAGDPPRRILVIGAGAFTFGSEDTHNQYDFVDIDPSLKLTAEKFILQRPLHPNNHFHPVDARAFLTENNNLYDLIILDAYQGNIMIPEHLVTKEFFAKVREALKDDGVMMGNFIVSPTFADAFSRNIDATLRSAFPFISRHIPDEKYDLFNPKPALVNAIYIGSANTTEETPRPYTDNRNLMFLDKPSH